MLNRDMTKSSGREIDASIEVTENGKVELNFDDLKQVIGGAHYASSPVFLNPQPLPP